MLARISAGIAITLVSLVLVYIYMHVNLLSVKLQIFYTRLIIMIDQFVHGFKKWPVHASRSS